MQSSFILLTGLAMAFVPTAAQAGGGGALKDYDPPLDPAFAELIRNADVDAGAAYFERKCSQCHDGAKDGANFTGPHLWNVVGRIAATHEGFRYSAAMQQVKHPWNYATLDHYLKDTEAAVPGRAMNFIGIDDDAERANVIAYLRTLSDTPVDLP